MEPHINNVQGADIIEADDEKLWFCVYTHPKQEGVAARGLKKIGGFEVFNPQLRIRKATRRGPVWFVESAFPGYIFVRFNLDLHLDNVRYATAVSKVVQFKSGYPVVPDVQVQELQALFGPDDIAILASDVSVGDSVRIVGGAFHDLVAVVQQVKPATERVQVLLEFLGRLTLVETDLDKVVKEERGHVAVQLLNLGGFGRRGETRAAF
jgi:transcriptional antiterminator RfaH